LLQYLYAIHIYITIIPASNDGQAIPRGTTPHSQKDPSFFENKEEHLN